MHVCRMRRRIHACQHTLALFVILLPISDVTNNKHYIITHK